VKSVKQLSGVCPSVCPPDCPVYAAIGAYLCSKSLTKGQHQGYTRSAYVSAILSKGQYTNFDCSVRKLMFVVTKTKHCSQRPQTPPPLGSHVKRQNSSPVRPLACNWYYCAQFIAKPNAACALPFSWAATSSNLGL